MTPSYDEILRSNPTGPRAAEAHYMLGIEARADGRTPDAMSHFLTAAEIPDSLPWNAAAAIEVIGLSGDVDDDKLADLESHLESLNTSTDAKAEMIHRGEDLLAAGYYTRSQWEKLAALPERTRKSEPDLIGDAIYQMMRGIACSRLGHYTVASTILEPLIEQSSPELLDGVVEYLDLIAREGQLHRAVQLTITQMEKLDDRRLEVELENFLHRVSDDAFLSALSETYNTGIHAFLIRKEKINRFLDEGLHEAAGNSITELGIGFPEYREYLKPLQSSLTIAREVDPRHIGLLVPLSGKLASIGHSIYRGSQLALTDYRRAGGSIEFDLCLIDSGDSLDTAERGFRELVIARNALAVIGSVRSQMTEALLPLCSAYRTVLISPGTPKEGIVGASDWAFRMYPSVTREIKSLVRFCVRDLGAYRFGCLYPDIEFGIDAAQALEEAVLQENAELSFSRRYARDLTNIRTSLASLSDSSTEILVVADNAEKAGVIAGHIRFQELLTPSIAGIGAWEAPDLIEIGGDNLQGSFFAVSYPSSSGPRRNVAERYAVEFGETPDPFALRAYEAVYLIIAAVESGVQYRPELKKWLLSKDGIPGLDGRTRFSITGEYLTPVGIFRVRGNGFEPWRVIPVTEEEAGPAVTPDLQKSPADPIPESPSRNPDSHPTPLHPNRNR